MKILSLLQVLYLATTIMFILLFVSLSKPEKEGVNKWIRPNSMQSLARLQH